MNMNYEYEKSQSFFSIIVYLVYDNNFLWYIMFWSEVEVGNSVFMPTKSNK